MKNMLKTRLGQAALVLVSVFFYNELFNYYVLIGQCDWPVFNDRTLEEGDTSLKALLLADTHLLGPYRGHWFDKLRREWQMHRAFQSAIYLHQPDVVFILGDLFDEGKWCNETQFREYVTRFHSLFQLPSTIKLFVVPGNHDIGFHYALHPFLVQMFETTFNITSIELVQLKKINFILINSMAMEGDSCRFCLQARQKFKQIADELNCLRRQDRTCKLKYSKISKYSRPIILQHFPMYRKSDSSCNEIDEAPAALKSKLFREKWDCLSQEASEMIYDELNPRLIITGHVHHGCHLVHRTDIHEYTLPSFSWRNKNNPTFMLAKFTPNHFVYQRCEIPRESTIIYTYITVITTIVIYMMLPLARVYGFY